MGTRPASTHLGEHHVAGEIDHARAVAARLTFYSKLTRQSGG